MLQAGVPERIPGLRLLTGRQGAIVAAYTVEAIRRVRLRTTVEAETWQEAHRIADEELITPDFEEVGGDFTLTNISRGES
jgi:hypothetical protein